MITKKKALLKEVLELRTDEEREIFFLQHSEEVSLDNEFMFEAVKNEKRILRHDVNGIIGEEFLEYLKQECIKDSNLYSSMSLPLKENLELRKINAMHEQLKEFKKGSLRLSGVNDMFLSENWYYEQVVLIVQTRILKQFEKLTHGMSEEEIVSSRMLSKLSSKIEEFQESIDVKRQAGIILSKGHNDEAIQTILKVNSSFNENF